MPICHGSVGTVARLGPRCGAWMVQAKALCGKVLGHSGKHASEGAVHRQQSYQNAYHTNQRAERHQKIDRYKLDKGCIDCGYREHPAALDFDHRDPSLKYANIAQMITYSWGAIKRELDKCDLRCANCHRIKTYYQRRRPIINTIVDDGPYDEI